LSKRKNAFREHFNQALVEKSEDYPFLDPFAAEFEYKNGKISFSGKVPVETFVLGLRDCIDVTLDKISPRETKDEMYQKIRSTLQPTISKFGEKIDDLGLKSVMPQLFSS